MQLGLDEPLGPPGVLKQATETFGRGQPGENVLYLYLLDACEKVFENELDQATFEEHMRWFFGTKVWLTLIGTLRGLLIHHFVKAYYLFTLDKVVMAIIKQVSKSCDPNPNPNIFFGPGTGPNDRDRQQMPGTARVAGVDSEAGKYDDLRRDRLSARSRTARWVRRKSISV